MQNFVSKFNFCLKLSYITYASYTFALQLPIQEALILNDAIDIELTVCTRGNLECTLKAVQFYFLCLKIIHNVFKDKLN